MTLPHVIVAGGSGLIGRELTKALTQSGYRVSLLTRNYHSLDNTPIIRWDPMNLWVDMPKLQDPTVIINLAGENLAKGKWTSKQKERIEESRVKAIQVIDQIIEANPGKVKQFISSSAIGYYGTFNGEQIFSEHDPAGSDYLAKVCIKWEEAIQVIANKGIDTSWVRTGVVLSNQGGALKAIHDSMKTGFAVPLGSGRQWIPWIHIQDLVQLFLFLLSNPALQGPFNGVHPTPVTNRQLTKILSKQKRKLFIPIGVPGPLLKLILGEMAVISLYGARVSSEKITQAGFKFQYQSINEALASFD